MLRSKAGYLPVEGNAARIEMNLKWHCNVHGVAVSIFDIGSDLDPDSIFKNKVGFGSDPV